MIPSPSSGAQRRGGLSRCYSRSKHVNTRSDASMAHSISIPPSFSTTSTPLRTSSLSEQAYVLSIVSLQTQYAASTSAPTNKIDIFDKSTLRRVQTLPGHEVATTALRSINRIGENHKNFLVSSGKDGQVIVWDDRTNSIGISSKCYYMRVKSKSRGNSLDYLFSDERG